MRKKIKTEIIAVIATPFFALMSDIIDTAQTQIDESDFLALQTIVEQWRDVLVVLIINYVPIFLTFFLIRFILSRFLKERKKLPLKL